MAYKTERDADYEKRSEKLAKEAEESLNRACAKATQTISKAADEAAQILVSLASTGTADDSVRLAAAKHILKITGMERERVEHTGSVSFIPVQFSRPNDGESVED